MEEYCEKMMNYETVKISKIMNVLDTVGPVQSCAN